MSELVLEDAAMDMGYERCSSCRQFVEVYGLIDGEIICLNCWDGD